MYTGDLRFLDPHRPFCLTSTTTQHCRKEDQDRWTNEETELDKHRVQVTV